MNNRYHKYTPYKKLNKTVFDVSSPVINKKNVCITGTNSSIIEQLTNRRIKCIIILCRHTCLSTVTCIV